MSLLKNCFSYLTKIDVSGSESYVHLQKASSCILSEVAIVTEAINLLN